MPSLQQAVHRMHLLLIFLNALSVALPASRLYKTGYPAKRPASRGRGGAVSGPAAAAAGLSASGSGGGSAALRYDTTLDSAGTLHLFWDIDDVAEVITFRLEAALNPYSSWLGVGFSDYGDPTDADLVLFWTDAEGRRHFQDAHTDHRGLLHADQSQDYTLDAAWVSPSHVSLTFHRDYDTCDDDDYIIDRGTTHIVFFKSHGRRFGNQRINVTSLQPGLQRVQLLRSQQPDPEFPDDTQTFVVHVDEVEIPAQETTYWCKLKKLPDIAEKHHIIQFEGVISRASQGIVHHMEVFHCDVPNNQDLPAYNAPCRTMGAERPPGLEVCRKVIGAWAMGARPLTYPAEAGVPVGGAGFSRYVMMEVHYNNPNIVSGVKDSSGIRFYVTSSLRPHDAAIMELGQEYTDKFALPPGQPAWPLTGYCLPECTTVALPDEGIKVFASQLHTHLTGKKVVTKHFRNGVELPELNEDEHYSPHYQEIRCLPRPVTVLPGDLLTTTCIDSTMGKNKTTLTGFSISDEMCVNYIHYYPATALEVCKSSITSKSLNGFFKFLHEYVEENTSVDKGISDNYRSIHWTPLNVHLLRTFYERAPLSMQCNQSDGSRFPGNWEDMPVPTVLFPLPPEERPCLQ